jgi:hypothetical protein
VAGLEVQQKTPADFKGRGPIPKNVMRPEFRFFLLCGLAAVSLRAQTTGYGDGMMVTGNVKMTDGSDVPPNINIQVVCEGRARTVAHTTINNDFSFFTDFARTTQAPAASNAFGSMDASNLGFPAHSNYQSPDRPQNCDLRAELGGFYSNAVNLSDPGNLLAFDTGVL